MYVNSSNSKKKKILDQYSDIAATTMTTQRVIIATVVDVSLHLLSWKNVFALFRDTRGFCQRSGAERLCKKIFRIAWSRLYGLVIAQPGYGVNSLAIK